MKHNNSISLSDHFEKFISGEVSSGRYNSASEVIGSALRLLEAEELKKAYINKALLQGEESGFEKDFDHQDHLAKLNKAV